MLRKFVKKPAELLSAGFFDKFSRHFGSCDINFKDIGSKFGGGIAQPFLNGFG
jgi:hypothetical protein